MDWIYPRPLLQLEHCSESSANKVTAVSNVSAAQLWHFRFTLLTGAICYNCDFPCRQVTFSMADFKISTVFLDFWFTATKTSKMLKRLTIMHIFPKSSQVSLWDIVSFLTSRMSWSQWAGMWICSLTVLCVLVCDVFVYCEDLHLGFGKDNAFTFLENSPQPTQPHPRRLRDFLQGWLSGHHDWGSIGNATRWTHHCTDY